MPPIGDHDAAPPIRDRDVAPTIRDDGWDCRVALQGPWLWRGPRHRRAEQRLRVEADLLAWLGPQLPLPVPAPKIHSDEPLRVRHQVIPGGPWQPGPGDRRQGEELGHFLRVLHGVPAEDAVAEGAVSADQVTAAQQADRDRFSAEVVPLLPHAVRPAALGLLMRQVAVDPLQVFGHGDLVGAHVCTSGDGIHGVIDWLDAGIIDPALDLAWPLHGTSPDFAAGIRAGYRLDQDDDRQLEARARDWYALAPWHAALRALDLDDAAAGRAALEEVSARLAGLVPGGGGGAR